MADIRKKYRQRLRYAREPVRVAMLEWFADVRTMIITAITAGQRSFGPAGTVSDFATWQRDPLVLTNAIDLTRMIAQLETRLTDPILNAIRRGWLAGAADVSLVGFDFRADLPLVRDAIVSSLELAKGVPHTVRDRLADSFTEAIRNGETGSNALVARVHSVVDGLKDWEALRIGRTSGGAGFSVGQMQAFYDANITDHIWRSQRVGQSRRDTHLSMDGEKVQIGTPFSNGLTFPRDPAGPAGEVINCECFLEPVAPSQ